VLLAGTPANTSKLLGRWGNNHDANVHCIDLRRLLVLGGVFPPDYERETGTRFDESVGRIELRSLWISQLRLCASCEMSVEKAVSEGWTCQLVGRPDSPSSLGSALALAPTRHSRRPSRPRRHRTPQRALPLLAPRHGRSLKERPVLQRAPTPGAAPGRRVEATTNEDGGGSAGPQAGLT
jgi:hypothetical protein